MKKRRKTLVVIVMISMMIGMDAFAAGCSNYVLYLKGDPRCTVKLCPGGLKRKA